jgi:hypothetical protein
MRMKRGDGAEALNQAYRWAAELGEIGELIGSGFPELNRADER